jgi:hypothetical protein
MEKSLIYSSDNKLIIGFLYYKILQLKQSKTDIDRKRRVHTDNNV